MPNPNEMTAAELYNALCSEDTHPTYHADTNFYEWLETNPPEMWADLSSKNRRELARKITFYVSDFV